MHRTYSHNSTHCGSCKTLIVLHNTRNAAYVQLVNSAAAKSGTLSPTHITGDIIYQAHHLPHIYQETGIIQSRYKYIYNCLGSSSYVYSLLSRTAAQDGGKSGGCILTTLTNCSTGRWQEWWVYTHYSHEL